MLSALFQYEYLQKAVLAVIFASIVCGVIGVIIIEKKLVMMSGGIAHTAYGGVGLGYMLGFEPILGAFLFAICAAFGIGVIKRKASGNSDVVIGLFWSLGMALGVLFIALTPGYPPDLSSYLFGSILAVTRAELLLTIILTVIVVLIIAIFFDNWKAYLFDEEFAAILGIKTTFMEYLLLILVAMTVVVLIRLAGIILVLALLTAPAALASILTKNLKRRMVYSVLLGMAFSLGGLWLSYEFNFSSGAMIVVLSVFSCLIAYGLRALIKPKRATEKPRSVTPEGTADGK